MDLTDDEKGTKLSFSDINYEKDQETIEAILGEQYYIIESAKAVYDWAVLAEILDGNISISDAKIKIYEKHKEDLSFLKRIVRSYFPPELYSKILHLCKDKILIVVINKSDINNKTIALPLPPHTK